MTFITKVENQQSVTRGYTQKYWNKWDTGDQQFIQVHRRYEHRRV